MAAQTTSARPTRADQFCGRRFDFIVVGGGTAGLAVAARLAENPSLTVGVLEAGVSVEKDDDIDIPGYAGRALAGPYDWSLETLPQPGLGGRKLLFNRGKILGGSSALNFMTWNRGCREDYDAWEDLGNPGWGWDSLLPFFKKSETFHPPPADHKDEYQASYRSPTAVLGTSGPIHVSYTNEYCASHSLWHPTLNSLGIATNKNHLGGSNVGVWTSVVSVNPETGTRSYAADYCSPTKPNLHILTEALVHEIVLEMREGEEQWTATGVRFTHTGREYMVPVTREVILSAGSVLSPQLLELSGVGGADVLTAAGVPVKVDNPNVGENLQDHLMLPIVFEVDPSLPGPSDHLRDDLAAAARKLWCEHRSGPLTVLPASISYLPVSQFMAKDAVASIKSRAEDLTCFPPEQKSILSSRFAEDKRLGQVEYIFDLGNWNANFRPDASEGKKYGTMLQILQYPFSRGSIHIQPASASEPTNAHVKPRIDPGLYAGTHGALDLELVTHCALFAAEICRTNPLASIIRGPAHPSPLVQSYDELRAWAVENTITDWHPVGTCAMGGRAGMAGGVVDERLRVYGVKGLRVADASVMPLQVSAHLQATVYAIAEKAAHMILENVNGL
ncbi:hypothetical protein VTK56DRAFT_3518 [Thermocarpiscus australiensis]